MPDWAEDVTGKTAISMVNKNGLEIQGYIDNASPDCLRGWVWRPARPDDAVVVQVREDGQAIARIVANIYRPDIAQAGIGTGFYGFELLRDEFKPSFGTGPMTVEDEVTGTLLMPSPTGLVSAGQTTALPAIPASSAALADDEAMAIQGYVDSASMDCLRGWVWRPGRPYDAVVVRVCEDGRTIARVVANMYRDDVAKAGVGTGFYGFELREEFKPSLGGSVIAVEDEATGKALTHSPLRLEQPLQLDSSAARAITALFDSPASDDELMARAEFAGREADRLLQRLADHRASRPARAAQRARKWRWRSEDGPEPPMVAPRALVIDNAIPSPNQDAGSNALISHMASLRRLGFDILFAPADMQGGRGEKTLEDMGIDYAIEPWYSSVEEVMRRGGAEFDLVYIHKHDPAARYVAMARHYIPRARRVYSVADLHGLRLARQAHLEDNPGLLAHAKFIHDSEVAAASLCHAVVTHSAFEADILRKALPHGAVEIIPWHVPVDATPQSFEQRAGLAFIGNYAHAPNLDAALWLRDEILPLVWNIAPEITCTLAGTQMPAMLTEAMDPRIHAVGQIEALSDLLGEVRLTVAPLAYGAGLKGKVADSLAMGVPCICSPIAAEGFDLPMPLRGLIASDAAGLAAAIVRLHRDPRLYAECREAGLAYMAYGFTESVVDAGLRRAVGLPAISLP